LQVPEPPPRVVAPVEQAVVATPLPAEAQPAPVAPPRSTPSTAETRPQPAPAPAPAPPAPPPAATPPAETRDLRAAPGSTNAATESGVRDLLARATRDLSRIDYQRLSTEQKATYDQSRRFSQQAQQALKERNVVFAETLADKAATLAAELLNQ
jgi:hypothetical protein